MVQRAEEPNLDHPFNQIEEGMDVYDAGGDKIGEVDAVFFGNIGDEAIEMGGRMADSPAIDLSDDSLMELLGDAFRDDLPREIAERLLNNGYLLVKGGLFSSDHFVLPDQLAGIDKDGVRLNVQADELLER